MTDIMRLFRHTVLLLNKINCYGNDQFISAAKRTNELFKGHLVVKNKNDVFRQRLWCNGLRHGTAIKIQGHEFSDPHFLILIG